MTMRRAFFLLMILMIATPASSRAAALQILPPGSSMPDTDNGTPAIKSGAGWTALTLTQAKPVSITVTRTRSAERDGEITVSAKDVVSPILFVRGLKPGKRPFKTVLYSAAGVPVLPTLDNPASPQESQLPLTLSDDPNRQRVYTMWIDKLPVGGALTVSPAKAPRYALVLYAYRFDAGNNAERRVTQTLSTYDGDSEAPFEETVVWAGDLDGDGELDLLMRRIQESGAEIYSLWLSSAAKPGELVGRAAEFTSLGC